MSIFNRIKKAFDVLTIKDYTFPIADSVGSNFFGSDFLSRVTVESMLEPIITRLAIDISLIPFRHVLLDQNGRFKEIKKSELNDRFENRANIDQTGPVLIQDAVTVLLNEGSCAIIPISTSSNPLFNPEYNIYSIRVGSVINYNNKTVQVSVYNEETGIREDITFSKYITAICYNPLYGVMNKSNSTLKRLIKKLSILDGIDEKTSSKKLDLIMHLPFSLRGDRRKEEAKARMDNLTSQLNESPYGIAYLDSAEKVTQLNRPVTNVLFDQIKELTESLYSQLGITKSVFDGTAGEKEMRLYKSRTLKPISKNLADSMTMTFLSKTAINRGERIVPIDRYFEDVTIDQLTSAFQILITNEVISGNEARNIMGLNISNDESAEKLSNKLIKNNKSE